jgi:heme exporter protein A
MSEPLLAFEQVTCDRGGRRLFEGLSFAIAAGEALAVTGPNGVGKSSLVRLAAGLAEPVAGRVARSGRVALLAESAALDPERGLADALRFWTAQDGGDALAALDAVGLAHLAPVPVRFLSTGQKRRAGLARVLASDARLWLLDEPGNGLDRAGLAMLGERIDAHRADGGAVLVATHIPLPGGAMREMRL